MFNDKELRFLQKQQEKSNKVIEEIQAEGLSNDVITNGIVESFSFAILSLLGRIDEIGTISQLSWEETIQLQVKLIKTLIEISFALELTNQLPKEDTITLTKEESQDRVERIYPHLSQEAKEFIKQKTSHRSN